MVSGRRAPGYVNTGTTVAGDDIPRPAYFTADEVVGRGTDNRHAPH